MSKKRKKKPGRKAFGYYSDEAAVVEIILLKRRKRKGAAAPTPWNQIARELTDEGYKTQLGKVWKAQTVKNTWLAAQNAPAVKKRPKSKTILGPGDFLDEAEVVEARRILTVADEGHLLMLFDFMVGTGLRASEAIQIRVCDISIRRKRCWVNVRTSVGKGKKARAVVIPVKLKDRINEYAGKVGRQNKDPFLARTGGAALNYRGLYDRVKKIGKIISIPAVHPHALRHTFAMTLYNYIKAQDRLEILQQQLGHGSPETTLIYLRTSKMIQPHQIAGFGELFSV